MLLYVLGVCMCVAIQDAVGSFIVLVCGLIVAYSGWPNADKVDSVGGLIV